MFSSQPPARQEVSTAIAYSELKQATTHQHNVNALTRVDQVVSKNILSSSKYRQPRRDASCSVRLSEMGTSIDSLQHLSCKEEACTYLGLLGWLDRSWGSKSNNICNVQVSCQQKKVDTELNWLCDIYNSSDIYNAVKGNNFISK